MRRGEVAGLAEIGGKIVELGGVLIRAQPFPVSFAHGEGLAAIHPPEESRVGRGGRLAGQERQEIDAIEGSERGVAGGAGRGERGGE